MAYRSPYPDIQVPNMNLTEQVFRHAATKPDADCDGGRPDGRTITYGSLLEQIRQTAAGLAARGIKKGDVVSLWSPNVPEWPVVFFAVVKLGAIVHTSNPVSTPEELAFQLNDAQREDAVHGRRARRQGEGGDRRVEEADRVVHDRRDAGHPVARVARDRQGSAGGVDRSRARHLRAAVFIGHDRACRRA